MTDKHHPGFWIGVFLFLAGLILFLIGFSSPYWLSTSNSASGSEGYYGLWLICGSFVQNKSDKLCDYYDRNTNAESMKATETLQCLALAGFALVCLLLYAEISSAAFRRRFRRSIEIVAFPSAVLGLLGVAVFGGAHVDSIGVGTVPVLKLDWAIALDIAGLLLILISAGVFAFVFAVCNKKRRLPNLAKYNPAYLPPEYDQRRMTDFDMRRMTHDYDQSRPAPDYEPRRTTQVEDRRDFDRRSASMDDLAVIPYRGVHPGIKTPYIVPYGPPIASRSYVYY